MINDRTRIGGGGPRALFVGRFMDRANNLMIDGMTRIPNFFIVGKPKAGTTALHYLLDQHPDIYMSPDKEPHHFHLEYAEAGTRRNRGYKGLPYKSRDNYLKLFEGAGAQKIVGESSTGYLYSPSAAREIAKFNPEAKILMVLRDPVDFVHSFHSQLLRSANEDEPDFQKALFLEVERKRGEKIPPTATYPDNLFYSEQVKYCVQVDRFLQHFERSQIKILIYDDLKANNLSVFREILQFLEIDSDFRPKFSDVNPTRKVRFPKLAVWVVFFAEKRKGSITLWAPEWLLNPIRRVLRGLFYSTGPRTQLDPELKQALSVQFKPEVVKLSEMLEVDLVKRWGYDEI